MIADLLLAARLLARDWRAGELRIILAAVALAVAGVTAVASLADRVRLSLERQANVLLAADLVLDADHPIPPAFEAEAGRRGLAATRTTTFLSMVAAGGRTRLAGIKAVRPDYPLRGLLRVADAPFAPDRPATGAPAPGEAWVDERLATELGLRPGSEVEVGDSRLRVTAVLTFEGERSGNFMALAPRLMMAEQALAATGLVQEGSRIRHRLLLAGEAGAVAAFRAWANPRLGRGQALQGVRDARPELRLALDRAQRYLGLAALLAVLLAAAAVQMSLRRYLSRHLDQFALLRCFGGSQARLLGLYLAQFACLGLLAGLLGGLLGLAVQSALTGLLGEVLRVGLPPPSPWPLLQGVLTGLLLVLAFSLPSMLRLARVPALRVLRRELGPPPARQWLAHALGLAVIAGLLFWQAGEMRLGLIVTGGLLAAMALAALIVQGLLALLPGLARRLPPGPRLGLLGLCRRNWETTLQAVALSLGLLALLLLTLVRQDLLAAWQGQIPAGAPNRFVINIQPGQVEAVRDFLARRGVAGVTAHPMVRGRLVAIAGRPVQAEEYEEGRARRLAEREFNLSSLERLPPDNVITAGRWWRDGGQDDISVEAGLAETLGIRLGDRLAFDVGGLPLEGRVASLRRVDWDSFRVNFFVVTPPGALAGMPASYITSFHLPRQRGDVLSGLVAAFPNLTVIDVDQVMAEARAIMDRVSGAVQVVFLSSLAVGLLVMLAALYARRDERALEIGIWRTLGASGGTVRAALATEFALLGLLAGVVAAGGASLLAWILADRVFDLAHVPDVRVWLAGVSGGVALVVGAGLAATRGLVAAPPLAAVRAGG